MTGIRKKPLATGLAIALVTAAILVAGDGTAQAKDGKGAGRVTDPAILAHAKKVAPLNAVANALGEQGRGAYSGVYGNLYVDENGGKVTLYVTDAQRGQKLIDSAKAAHPGIDTGLIKITIAKYAKKDLDAQAQQIVKATAAGKASNLEVYTVSVNPDSSGITVTGKSGKLASIKSKVNAAIVGPHSVAPGSAAPVSVVAGDPLRPASWRWNDGAPQIGGDVLLGAAHTVGTAQCTAGMAVENSAGRDYLITAAHCFDGVSNIYGEGDNEGHFGYRLGDWIGKVVNTNDHWDAQLIDTGRYNGAGSNSDEADDPAGKWYAVKGTANSYNGQTVCQDGARSYYTGHGVPCGITVQNEDVTYNLPWSNGTVHSVRGVKGYQPNWAVTQGDSGALVFSVTNSTDRQARGIVSAGSTTENQTIYWTEAPDILRNSDLSLNPHS
ncbi:hypothetical protein ACIHFE_29675 [Streptomyces sp. NPDC052396]|uniref:hypothetical protein n=1 Tax=Streptomyces sp. NPDC052396 TaxID=3365689 RepID=UPI0037D3BA78